MCAAKLHALFDGRTPVFAGVTGERKSTYCANKETIPLYLVVFKEISGVLTQKKSPRGWRGFHAETQKNFIRLRHPSSPFGLRRTRGYGAMTPKRSLTRQAFLVFVFLFLFQLRFAVVFRLVARLGAFPGGIRLGTLNGFGAAVIKAL